jgi:hypothetical protein
VSRVTDLYATARRAFERGEAAQWEAAEAMADLADLGETQREIAAKVGCSQGTVSWYVRAFRDYPVITNRPRFEEAIAALRGDRNEGSRVPKTSEKRAELVADLLKDKAVADAPVVRKVQERHADRRLRAEAAAFNREHNVPTRTEAARDDRRVSTLANKSFWTNWLAEVQRATRLITEGIGEIERTGLPRSGSGEAVRAARALARVAQRFEDAATSAGIGKAM